MARTPAEEALVRGALEANPIFGVLGADTRQTLSAVAELRTYSPHEIVLREGEPPLGIFVVVKGTVRVFHRSVQGSEVVIKVFGPPAIFGEMEQLVGVRYLQYADVRETTLLLRIPGDAFTLAVRSEPAMAFELIRDLAARLCIASQNEKALAFCTVRERLAHFLLSSAMFDGFDGYGGRRLRLPLSQNDMALALAVTRRAVAKEISRWQQEGIIVKERGHYLIADMNLMREDAGDLSLGVTYKIGKLVQTPSGGEGEPPNRMPC